MRTVMVLNAKGGSGKTTIATNLAGYFASRGAVSALKDYDPLGSSMEWLRHRPAKAPIVHGLSAFAPPAQTVTRSWALRLPANTEYLTIDTPAGIDPNKLITVMKNVDRFIIPVVPSPIDVRASGAFIRSLLNFMKLNPCRGEIALVASRATRDSRFYQALQRVFASFDLPFVSAVSSSEHYNTASEQGLSLFELNLPSRSPELQEWDPLIDWIDGKQPNTSQSLVYALARRR